MDDLERVLDLQERESDRYWNRSNILLIVEGALVAGYSGLVSSTPHVAMAIAVVGVLVGFIWLGVLDRGKKYVQRWSRVAKLIEDEVKPPFPILALYEKQRTSETRSWFLPYRRNTTSLMKWTVAVVVSFWLAAIGFAIGEMVAANSTGDSEQQVVRVTIDED